MPREKPSLIKMIRRATARTISGTMMGIYSMLFTSFLPLNSYFFRPRAPMVPMKTEMMVLSTAMMIVYHKLSISAWLENSFPYHSVVKPFQ